MLNRTLLLRCMLGLAGLCSASARAAPPEWIQLNESEGMKVSLDVANIKVREGVLTAWVRQEHQKDQDLDAVSPKKKYRSARLLMAFKCDSEQAGLVAITYYASNDAVVYSRDREIILIDWEYVVPDSLGSAMLERVCEHAPPE